MVSSMPNPRSRVQTILASTPPVVVSPSPGHAQIQAEIRPRGVFAGEMERPLGSGHFLSNLVHQIGDVPAGRQGLGEVAPPARGRLHGGVPGAKNPRPRDRARRDFCQQVFEIGRDGGGIELGRVVDEFAERIDETVAEFGDEVGTVAERFSEHRHVESLVGELLLELVLDTTQRDVQTVDSQLDLVEEVVVGKIGQLVQVGQNVGNIEDDRLVGDVLVGTSFLLVLVQEGLDLEIPQSTDRDGTLGLVGAIVEAEGSGRGIPAIGYRIVPLAEEDLALVGAHHVHGKLRRDVGVQLRIEIRVVGQIPDRRSDRRRRVDRDVLLEKRLQIAIEPEVARLPVLGAHLDEVAELLDTRAAQAQVELEFVALDLDMRRHAGSGEDDELRLALEVGRGVWDREIQSGQLDLEVEGRIDVARGIQLRSATDLDGAGGSEAERIDFAERLAEAQMELQHLLRSGDRGTAHSRKIGDDHAELVLGQPQQRTQLRHHALQIDLTAGAQILDALLDVAHDVDDVVDRLADARNLLVEDGLSAILGL